MLTMLIILIRLITLITLISTDDAGETREPNPTLRADIPHNIDKHMMDTGEPNTDKHIMIDTGELNTDRADKPS